MHPTKKELIGDLLVTLEPHLAAVTLAGEPLPKPLAKTIRQLAKQLLAARLKQEKQATRAVSSAGQQKLTDELLAVIHTHLGEDAGSEKAVQRLEEAAEELAGQVTKVRTKRQRHSVATELPETEFPAETPARQDSPASTKRPRRTKAPKIAE